MEHRIKNHRIANAPFRMAVDHGGELAPDMIVIHFTAGGSAAGSVDWLTRADDSYVSAHVVLDRESGAATQLVPFNTLAYHAGRSEWRGRKNLNRYAIGIELANWGGLARVAGNRYLSWAKTEIDPDRVIKARHKNAERYRHARKPEHWERFTPCQLAATLRLCRALIETYPAITEIVGHDDISPDRKIDPGPAFPMEWLQGHAFEARTIYDTEPEADTENESEAGSNREPESADAIETDEEMPDE